MENKVVTRERMFKKTRHTLALEVRWFHSSVELVCELRNEVG